MRALLDVNVLLALRDRAHAFHRTAARWLDVNEAGGIATCPLTQNGVVRILSQPNYGNPLHPAEALAQMRDFCAQSIHQFWADDVSIFDIECFDHSQIHGHRQLTDIYLLGLAIKHQGRFVTFDQQIPLKAVRGAAKKHLVVI